MKFSVILCFLLASAGARAQNTKGHSEVVNVKEELAVSPLCDKPQDDPDLQKVCSAFCVTTYFAQGRYEIGSVASPESHLADYVTRVNIAAPVPAEANSFMQKEIRAARSVNVEQIATYQKEILGLDKGKRGLKEMRRMAGMYLHPEDWKESQIDYQRAIYKTSLLFDVEYEKKMVFDRLRAFGEFKVDAPVDDGSQKKFKIEYKGRKFWISYMPSSMPGEVSFISDLVEEKNGEEVPLCKKRVTPTSNYAEAALSDRDFRKLVDSICHDAGTMFDSLFKEMQKGGINDPLPNWKRDDIKNIYDRYMALMAKMPATFKDYMVSDEKKKNFLELCSFESNASVRNVFAFAKSSDDLRWLIGLGLDPLAPNGEQYLKQYFLQMDFLVGRGQEPVKNREAMLKFMVDRTFSHGVDLNKNSSTLMSGFAYGFNNTISDQVTPGELELFRGLANRARLEPNAARDFDWLALNLASGGQTKLFREVLAARPSTPSNPEEPNLLDRYLENYEAQLQHPESKSHFEMYERILLERGFRPMQYKGPLLKELQAK